MKIAGKQRFPLFVLPLCLAWVFPPPVQAKNSLNCTIINEADKPLAKQEVALVSKAAQKEQKKKTNDKGEVEFKGLDDGAYEISVAGYISGKAAPIELSGNTEKNCKYDVLSAEFANGKLSEVMQLVQQRKYGEAEQKSKTVVAMMPNEGAAHYVLALSYAFQGNEGAVAEIKKAAELSPDKFQKNVIPIQLQALNQEAEMDKQKGDNASALKRYEAMLALSPNDNIVYYNMALVYGRQNNYEQALKSIDKAIQFKPDDIESQRLKIQLQDSYLKEMDKKLERK